MPGGAWQSMRWFAGAVPVLVGVVLGAMCVQPASAEVPLPPKRPSLNLFGMTGLIDTPTAEMQPDAQISATSGYFGGYLRNTVAFQITPWLEGAFRYSVLEKMLPAPGERTLYDRSFDLKLRLVEESDHWPAAVFGLQDFLGTGVYSGEYFAATKTLLEGDLKVTGGLGWGRFGGNLGLDNPLCRSGNRFCDRSGTAGTGGTVDAGQFFSGRDLGLFGGLEWQTPIGGLALKAEYSDDEYRRERNPGDFDPDLPFNVGLEYRPRRGIELGAYYMYGSEFGLRLSLSGNPFQPLAEVDGEAAPSPIVAGPQPADDGALFGKIVDLTEGGPVTSPFSEDRITAVTIETDSAGLRWARATLPASAGYDCPDAQAAAVDAQFGVVDAVSFRHPDGTLVCTVALRPAAQQAMRQAVRAQAVHPTDWHGDEVQHRAAVDVLVAALDADRIGLLGISLEPTRVTVYIENAKFRAMPRAIGRTARALAATMPASVEQFEIVPVEGSLPVASVTLVRSDLEDTVERPDAARAVWLSAAVDEAAPFTWHRTEHRLDQFPRATWSINPALPVNLFDPDSPVRFDLSVVANGGVEVLPGLSLNGAVQKRIAGTLDENDANNDSDLPRVRSDIARYQSQGDPAIARLTSDYVTKLDRDLYGRVSAGLLERMFGGASAELLWKPVSQN